MKKLLIVLLAMCAGSMITHAKLAYDQQDWFMLGLTLFLTFMFSASSFKLLEDMW